MSANCPHCGCVPMENVGREGKCPKCGRPLRRNIFYSANSSTAVCPSCASRISLSIEEFFDCSNCGAALQKTEIL